jgi:hypothetical protein
MIPQYNPELIKDTYVTLGCEEGIPSLNVVDWKCHLKYGYYEGVNVLDVDFEEDEDDDESDHAKQYYYWCSCCSAMICSLTTELPTAVFESGQYFKPFDPLQIDRNELNEDDFVSAKKSFTACRDCVRNIDPIFKMLQALRTTIKDQKTRIYASHYNVLRILGMGGLNYS